MRKLILSALAVLFTAVSLTAQSGEDQMKAAGKAFDSYKVSNNAIKLQEAVDALAAALQDSEVTSDYKNYLEAGDIYAGAVAAYVQDRAISAGEPVEPIVAMAASRAAEMYMKAYNMTEKKGGRRAALKGLEELQGNLSNEGIFAIQDGDYKSSFTAFNNSVKVHDFITEQGGTSAFAEDATKLDGERYYAALSAVLNEDFDGAEPLLLALYESNYDDYGVYDGLFKVYSSRDDEAMASKYLSEGRERYPDETQLLFTEINYYLSQGRLDELTGKLQEAIDAEPDNVSLYATLGNVYDQLYQKKNKEMPEEAQGYFDKAIQNYEKGLEIESDNASLIYSIGALYFNRAAAMTEELAKLGNDFSKEGQKKYEALEEKVNAEFDAAYPYFKKAEVTDPNNLSTLIALKEIFARRDNYEASNEMKARLEKVQAGEKIEESYFEANGMK